MKNGQSLLRRALFFAVLMVSCSRPPERMVLVHYYPFGSSPYAPIPLWSPDDVAGTLAFSVSEKNKNIQMVLDRIGRLDRGEFNSKDVRLVIRFEDRQFVAVDSRGGALVKGKQGKLPPDDIKAVANAIEAIPENPYLKTIRH